VLSLALPLKQIERKQSQNEILLRTIFIFQRHAKIGFEKIYQKVNLMLYTNLMSVLFMVYICELVNKSKEILTIIIMIRPGHTL